MLDDRARLYTLAELSNAFAMVATDYRSLVDKIARTTAEYIGDGCLVTLIADDGEHMLSVASAHRVPALELDYKSYLVGLPISKTTSPSMSAQVLRSGVPKLVPVVAPADLVAQSEEALRPLVARLDVHSFTVVPIRARGTIIGTLSLYRSGPGRSYTEDDVTLAQDLADRAGLAIENARLYDDLERRVRQRTAELEALNQELEAFSYSVAHDLRAPLRSIDGFSKILLDDYGDRLDAEGLDHLAHVRGAAQRMGRLIDDLLGLARVTGGELQRERVDLSELARVVMARLQATSPTRAVEVTIEAGMAAHGDARLLDIVLTNLLGNAWKFTSKQAAARIEVAHSGAEPDVYRVTDNGAGFDPQYAARLFGVFQRLHAASEFDGTGIGLATVQRIIRRHGGTLGATGAVGAGATFWFTLAAA